MSDLVRRLREPPFGTETSERNLMAAAADHLEALEAENKRLRGVVNDARLQLEYLNEKQERGSTNGVLAQTRAALKQD